MALHARAAVVRGELILTVSHVTNEGEAKQDRRKVAKRGYRWRKKHWRCPTCGVLLMAEVSACLACLITGESE